MPIASILNPRLGYKINTPHLSSQGEFADVLSYKSLIKFSADLHSGFPIVELMNELGATIADDEQAYFSPENLAAGGYQLGKRIVSLPGLLGGVLLEKGPLDENIRLSIQLHSNSRVSAQASGLLARLNIVHNLLMSDEAVVDSVNESDTSTITYGELNTIRLILNDNIATVQDLASILSSFFMSLERCTQAWQYSILTTQRQLLARVRLRAPVENVQQPVIQQGPTFAQLDDLTSTALSVRSCASTRHLAPSTATSRRPSL